jgi:hypothetical protein
MNLNEGVVLYCRGCHRPWNEVHLPPEIIALYSRAGLLTRSKQFFDLHDFGLAYAVQDRFAEGAD